MTGIHSDALGNIVGIAFEVNLKFLLKPISLASSVDGSTQDFSKCWPQIVGLIDLGSPGPPKSARVCCNCIVYAAVAPHPRTTHRFPNNFGGSFTVHYLAETARLHSHTMVEPVGHTNTLLLLTSPPRIHGGGGGGGGICLGRSLEYFSRSNFVFSRKHETQEKKITPNG